MIPPAVHVRIAQVADREPDSIALVQGQAHVTYGALQSAADEVARGLHSIGVRPGDLVGLYCDRSFETVIGILGILRAAATYVPLEPSYPGQWLARMVEQTRLNTVAVSPARRAELPFDGVRSWVIGDAAPRDGQLQPMDSHVTSRLAYVNFTSGSTGLPKGVLTTHDNLSVFLRGMAAVLGTDSSARYLFRTSPSFDPHTVEIFLPLLAGGRVVVAPQVEPFSPSVLGEAANRHRVNLMQATPTIWRAMLADGWRPAAPLSILCGGEALTDSLKDALLGLPGAELWNVYGPTETTVWCAALRVRPGEPARIGGFLDGVSHLVLDEALDQVADGIVGQLFIAGDGLADGYLDQPGQTAASFVPHPRAPHPGARIYRSGDLVVRHPDGTLEFVGRSDRQVKIRGHRVELRAVEAAIDALGLTSEAAVLADGNDRLIAYVVPRDPNRSDKGLVRDILEVARRSLPSHMVPSTIHVLAGLPRTPNLKVDRQALTRIGDAPASPRSAEQQRDSLVERVSRVWGKVLGCDRIQIDDHFLDVGGHSLNLVTLQVDLKDELGIDLSPPELLRLGTIERISRYAASAGVARSELSPGEPSPPRSACMTRLSTAQACLFEEMPRELIDRNNLELLIATSAAVETARRAIDVLLARHDVFRIDGFPPGEAGRVQRFAAEPVAAPRRCGATTRDVFLDEVHAARRRISVAAGRLYEWTIARIGDETWVYFIGNHLIVDGVSLDILKDELDRLLQRVDANLPATTPFARWAEVNGSEDRESELHYWRTQVERPSIEALVRDDTADGDGLEVLEVTMNKVASGSRSPSVRSRHDWFLAACAHAFARTFEVRAVPCRIVHAGRNLRPDMADARTVGWLSHHHPLWLEVSDDLAQTARAVGAALAQIPRRGSGYGWLRYGARRPELVAALSLGQFPLYVNYLPVGPPSRAFVELALPPLPEARQDMLGLAVIVADAADRARITLCFDRGTMRSSTANTFLGLLRGHVERSADTPVLIENPFV